MPLNRRLLFVVFITLVEVILNIGRRYPDSDVYIIQLSKLHDLPWYVKNRLVLPILAGLIAPFWDRH